MCRVISGFFNLVPLIIISVFVLGLYCLDDCSFVVLSEVRKPDSSSSTFLCQIALTIQGLLCFHTNCALACSSSVINVSGCLIRISLNL